MINNIRRFSFLSMFVKASILILAGCNNADSPENKYRTRIEDNKIQITHVDISPKIYVRAYPDFIVDVSDNHLVWKDGTRMVYDDGKGNKSIEEYFTNPDLQDQLAAMNYPKDGDYTVPSKDADPGRIRYEPFFCKMYGSDKETVQSNLVEIVWLPKHLNQVIRVTRINKVSEKLKEVSKELDENPELVKYLENPGGTFVWREISGTDNLSAHSFGISIDINVQYSNYWQWDNKDWKTKGGALVIPYMNRIPYKIVQIFRKHGFIWGGNWYHYDTMHFEYRPEMLLANRSADQ